LFAKVVLLLSFPASAWASCRQPGSFLSPHDGASVPVNPVIHAFVVGPGDFDWKVSDENAHPLQHRVVALPSIGVFRAFRVEIQSADATSVVIGESRYTVDRAWKAPSATAVTVDSVTASNYLWDCSKHETRNLVINEPADAYRVIWAESAESWERGERKEVVLPAHIFEAFRSRHDEVPPKLLATGRVELGYANCTGLTFVWKGPIWAGVIGLFSDGSETTSPVSPLLIEPPPAATKTGSDSLSVSAGRAAP